MKDNVEGIDVPDEVIMSMEKEGTTGIEIACNIIRDIHKYVDGIHIMALGDVKGTNQIIEYVTKLTSES
jgi:5,10-methylenetetrahydrofolate reductase